MRALSDLGPYNGQDRPVHVAALDLDVIATVAVAAASRTGTAQVGFSSSAHWLQPSTVLYDAVQSCVWRRRNHVRQPLRGVQEGLPGLSSRRLRNLSAAVTIFRAAAGSWPAATAIAVATAAAVAGTATTRRAVSRGAHVRVHLRADEWGDPIQLRRRCLSQPRQHLQV